MAIGFSIAVRARQVSIDQIARARGLPVANVSDCMSRMQAGTAAAVRTRPGDNLIVHRAPDLAQPGDVVVDTGGDLTNAIIGELMQSHAIRHNRANNSHQPTQKRERQMKRFKSPGRAQRFLPARDGLNNLFSAPPSLGITLRYQSPGRRHSRVGPRSAPRPFPRNTSTLP